MENGIPFRGMTLSTLYTAGESDVLLVLAHGTNGGMRHPLLEAAAARLSAAGISVLRFNFPYREEGKENPNSDTVLGEAWSAAVAAVTVRFPEKKLFLGGKSLGARTAAAWLRDNPAAPVRGLVFLGFPLHAPGKPGLERGLFLRELARPCFFAQGTRDALAGPDLVRQVAAWRQDFTLLLIEGGDHSLRSGRSGDDPVVLWPVLGEWLRKNA